MSKCPRCKVTVEMEENMKVENGKIIEITEQELYSRYIDGEYYMALDFNEYKWRMENAGTKIVKWQNRSIGQNEKPIISAGTVNRPTHILWLVGLIARTVPKKWQIAKEKKELNPEKNTTQKWQDTGKSL